MVKGLPDPRVVTAKWTFGGRWDPEAILPSVLPFAGFPLPKNGETGVPTQGTALRWISGRSAVNHIVRFGEVNPPPVMSTTTDPCAVAGDLRPSTTFYWRVDEVTEIDTIKGLLWKFRTAADGSAGQGKE